MDCKTEKAGIPDYAGMKQMLDYLKVSYWLVDPDYVLMDVNETFLRFTGGKREKLIGRNILTLVQPEEAELIKQKFRQLTESQSAIQFELYVYGPRNRIKIPALFHLTVNRDASRRVISFNMLISDISIQKNLEKKEQELFHARRKLRQEALKDQMIGASKSMEAVIYSTLRCAEVDSPVLITGETGVGKEVVARAIHSHSIRHKNPFVAVNCGSLPGELLESELFGHVKGAFTGAISSRPGLFREAEGGTLFLDEIAEIEKRLQVKLLRAIQENEIRAVGDDRTHKVDLRIICATNQDLRQLAEAGSFRKDLFYRISVVPIHIPPLRERPEDIIKLAEHFVRTQPRNKRFTSISAKARRLLSSYHWPGNIRELQNAIEHAMVMSQEKTLLPDALPREIVQQIRTDNYNTPNYPQSTLNNSRSLKREEEKNKIIAALQRHNGNQTAAAKELGISRVTLWRKKTMYNI
jgi:two-component system NtrC family response regulator